VWTLCSCWNHLASASPDLLREMIAVFANAIMSDQADQVCGAGYGERSDQRVNRRNGCRAREWDTRVGTVELAIPKLWEGSYYPDWLLTLRGCSKGDSGFSEPVDGL
jgi:putative transposase